MGIFVRISANNTASHVCSIGHEKLNSITSIKAYVPYVAENIESHRCYCAIFKRSLGKKIISLPLKIQGIKGAVIPV